MAIYHLSMQVITRSKGQSAVASASYRSGERLTDERTGEVKFYKRNVKPETMILAPENSPKWVNDRQRLWNEVEKVEKRKDSQLAREMNIALPRELSNAQQRELIQEFVQEQFVNKGMIADISIHRDDKENPHAHIMLTMRTIDENGFGKKNRDWNAEFSNSKENNRGFVKLAENCLDIREQWSEYANKALEEANINERISHLSHEARGLEQLPTVHLGHVAHGMEQRGIETERGDLNRERQSYNAVVVDLQKYREEKKALEQKLLQEQNATPEEKISLHAAKHLLSAEPTFESIQEKIKELKQEQSNIASNQDKFGSMDKAIDNVSRLYKDNDLDKRRLSLEESNPIKVSLFGVNKERQIKEKMEQAEKIEGLKEVIKQREEAIKQYQVKLGFTDRKHFEELKEAFRNVNPLENVKKQLTELKGQQNTLEKAQNALENRFIRSVAHKYPNNPEMAYLDFKTATAIDKFSKEHLGGETIPVEVLKEAHERSEKHTATLKEQLEHLKQYKHQISGLDHDYSMFNTFNKMAKKYEENPLYKGKIANGMPMPMEYVLAKTEAQKLEQKIKGTGIENLKEYPKIKADIDKELEMKLPQLEKSQAFTDILGGIMQGIEQANHKIENANQKKKHRKSRHRKPEFELER